MESETTTLFLRGVPREVVREAKAAAAREGATLGAFVAHALRRRLAAGAAPDADGASLEASERWYGRNAQRLLRRYPGKWLAIIDERLVDSDADWEALSDRVFDRFGVRSFFMPRAEAGERVVKLRSPRVVRQ